MSTLLRSTARTRCALAPALAVALLCLAPTPSPAIDDDEAEAILADPDEAHRNTYLEASERYPSATACGECHPKHYRQWSISQHAYAQMSPVFNAMQGTISKLTNGTLGDFCIRCHTPVGMNLREPEFMSNIDRHPTSREGITCVVCHRVNLEYSKISGRLHLEEGPLTSEIYGPTGDDTQLEEAIEEGGLVTDPSRAGRKVHAELDQFFQITTGGFCGVCHDVVELNGFRLEDAFSEWKNSPAAKAGISCQDCHMGKEPGKILAPRDAPDFERVNYDRGPAAVVGSRGTEPRKLTNHFFVGPDHSVLPPALFPLNILAIKEESEKDDPTARGLATIREWLLFDWEAGWGTDEFEDTYPDPSEFPERWASIDDRYDARAIIEDNLTLLREMRVEQLKLLRNGYGLGEIEVAEADQDGIEIKVQVKSNTTGHNVPTGFDGERVVWLYVRFLDGAGNVIHQSGDLDPNGDVRDLHSLYVHNHELPLDRELFSLQGRFLTLQARGPETEHVIAVPRSPTAMRFLQPEFRSSALLGRHFGARKHRFGIEPYGHRWASYEVSEDEMTSGPYKAVIQLKAAMIPVNLVNEIRHVGFDYGLSARDVAEAVIAGHQIVWERTVDIDI